MVGAALATATGLVAFYDRLIRGQGDRRPIDWINIGALFFLPFSIWWLDGFKQFMLGIILIILGINLWFYSNSDTGLGKPRILTAIVLYIFGILFIYSSPRVSLGENCRCVGIVESHEDRDIKFGMIYKKRTPDWSGFCQAGFFEVDVKLNKIAEFAVKPPSQSMWLDVGQCGPEGSIGLDGGIHIKFSNTDIRPRS